MKTIEAAAAGPELSSLIEELERSGEPVRILRNGKPVADLSPVRESRDPLIPDPQLQGVQVFCDLTAPLSDEEWPEECR